ncbi:MAG: PfkB family carbohydrate kinase [Chloroflexota bacterium]
MKLAGVGDNVVDRYMDLGLMFPGGQALNVAVYARRFGLESAYVGAIGDDVAGRQVLGAMRSEGLDISRLRIVAGTNAHAEVALVDGDRQFMGGNAGVSKFRLSESDLAYLSEFDFVHSSESSYLEDQLGLLAGVAPVSFDFAVRRDPAYIEPLLPHVTIAEFSLGDLDEGAAKAWLQHIQSLGPRLVLGTRGASGALLLEGDRFWYQPTVSTEVIDTLGAGDAFIARVLVGVVRGEPFEISLAEAAVAAASTCRAYGAFGYGTAAYPPHSSDWNTTVVSGSPANQGMLKGGVFE